MSSTIVGCFDDVNEARQAETELLSAGFGRDSISLVAGQTQTQRGGRDSDNSLWEDIKEAFGFSSESDRAPYQEAARRGSAVLTARVPEEREEMAADIIERHHPIDIDRRAEEWRASGWTGYMAVQTEMPQDRPQQPMRASDAGNQPEQREAIPVVEEQIKVGKRPISRGGVRIHKHVTETPVVEEVRLREEQVHVERRPTDRPVTERDRAFEDQTIEMTETAEEAVVSKEARVVEEVEVSKDVRERREQVRDTVRREDVEVEDLAAAESQQHRAMPGRNRDEDFRADFERNYATSGSSFDEYRPAYEFGHGLADNQSYQSRSWDQIEADARQRYDQSYPGRWDAHRQAIRAGFERNRRSRRR